MDADELLRRYAKKVYNVALRLTGDAADADDVAQEALIRALKGLPGFRGGDAGVWVYRITVNAWKNFLRAKSARRMLRFLAPGEDEVLSEPFDAASSEAGPEKAAERAGERAAIDGALAKLEPEDRAVLVLRELDGLAYAQIADVLDIPLGTVKSRLTRARFKLAELLKEVRPDGS